ncbi:hypothetical protein CK936_00110 [Streptomyces albireticuli]|uniref:Uncharacterized protein n=1 Tax=Streptomyces albireticuli TaxID=1940 RepID=A0A2A2DHM1_9ACTN|nr:hypothetical protein CK936_00110 [Streptomyces albireticuli]
MQQTRAAKHAKQAKQRKAAASRNAATVATNLPMLTAMDDTLFGLLAEPWGDFTDTYPTVEEAVAAAEEAGGGLSCFSFHDSGEYERSLHRDTDDWRYEVALYPRGPLRELVKTTWLDADDRDQAMEQLHRVLAAYVPESLRRPGLETVQRPSTTSVPRIGWAQSLPVAGMQTWEDLHLAEKKLPLLDLAPFAVGPGRAYEPLPEETFALFHEHGLSARACAGCGAPVTDRHPHWPGVLVSVEYEGGPVCDRSRLGGGAVRRVGHVLDADQARPAGQLTGKEQKVPCQNCDVHVTEQHPDWPGVWAEAGGYSRPVCAVVGSVGDDAKAYDLVDCVYPHIPAGADSPAAAAIAAAKKSRYFFQPRLPIFQASWGR